MNKRALILAGVYTTLIIIFKLVILLGGYTLTKFGFYYSNLAGILFIYPFFYLVIQQTRDKDYSGIIGGREAIRLALTVLIISAMIISIYNYIEFNWKFRDIAVQYYNSKEYRDILSNQLKLQSTNDKIQKIIEEQLRDLSAFKGATMKLIPTLFFGFGGAFTFAMFLKKSAK